MRTRSFGTTDLRCSEIGFGTWALGSNWWGKVTSGEGVNLIRRALELGDHVLRHRRRLREGRERGDRGKALAGRSARVDPDLDQVRLRARGAPAGALAGRAATGLVPRACPRSARGQPAAARHRLRRPLPAAQPAHGRDRARRPVRGAGAPARRGQAAPLRRRARSGDRLARRGPARARRARRRVTPDRLQRARAAAGARLPRGGRAHAAPA